jgi:hypothetical protein
MAFISSLTACSASLPRKLADAQQVVARLGPGDVVGEMGCITGQPRTATVRALRNTELLSIAWDEVERLAAADPAVLLSVCKTAIQRLVLAQEGKPHAFRPRTFSIIAGSDGIDVRSIGEKLAKAFNAIGRTVLVTRETFPSMTTEQLFQLESQNQFLIFVTEAEARPGRHSACGSPTPFCSPLAVAVRRAKCRKSMNTSRRDSGRPHPVLGRGLCPEGNGRLAAGAEAIAAFSCAQRARHGPRSAASDRHRAWSCAVRWRRARACPCRSGSKALREHGWTSTSSWGRASARSSARPSASNGNTTSSSSRRADLAKRQSLVRNHHSQTVVAGWPDPAAVAAALV